MIIGNIKNAWFHEKNTLWPGMSLALEVKNVLYEEYSKFQDILVFESATFGNVLVLDGVIQITERDESSYQESLAHTPLHLHSAPKNILIIGGGDGGILREVLKHNSVERVVHCEIDADVVDVSKKFFPTIASGFVDPRLELIIGDGAEYVRNTDIKFDIVIIDSSDPIGPAESLYVDAFYADLKKCMSPQGVLALQGESLFLHEDLAKELIQNMSDKFRFARYAQVHVPTYPAGNIGLLVCSDMSEPGIPVRECDIKVQSTLQYYSTSMHTASFVLPYKYESLDIKK